MAKGSSSRSGPPPDPFALRRERDKGDWVTLPQGREGAAPEWPLIPYLVREGELWEREWRRPQAVMWERNGQEIEVALYVRSLVEAEEPGAAVSARGLLRQQQEALGISLPGLARNRWRISGQPTAVESQVPPAKARFKVVGRDAPAA